MLIIDGLLAVARQVAKAVEQEREREEEAIKAELRELYTQLEDGQISEEECDAREAALLDRLDALTGGDEEGEGEEGEGEGDEEAEGEGGEGDAP